MTLNTEHWLKALLAAFVTGCSGAGLSALGIVGADTVGLNVQQLNPKQFGIMVLAGGIVGALAYLKQSPVPPDDSATPPPPPATGKPL